MATELRVLVVEDCPDDAALVLRELRRGGFEPAAQVVDSAEAMASALDRQGWDIVISDHNMPGFSAPEALDLLKRRSLDIPFVIVSGSIGEDQAVEAMKAGAHDYLMKGRLVRLCAAVERERREAEERRARRHAEERVRHLAYFDPLTDLPNAIRFEEELTRAVTTATSSREPVALVLLSVQGIPEINNTLGRHSANALLRAVAARLRETSPDRAVLARIGAEEFPLVLSGWDADAAAELARQLVRQFERPFDLDGFGLEAGLVAGIAVFPGHGGTAETLLKRADIAATAARRQGTGVVLYSTDLDPYEPDRLALVGELRHAIERSELLLHYQPVVDLKSRRTTGVEALVRWNHPRHGLVPPDRFIGLAERTGLIEPLTHWVLKEAVRQGWTLNRDGLDVSVAANLSARNLQDAHLPEKVGRILGTWGLPAERLVLEITESTVMEDPVRSIEVLKRLRGMGVQLSIDDFGTGYSSIGYLRRLPATIVKLDRSLVSGIVANREDALVVQSVAELVHHLGLKVLAEGVEDQQTLDLLTACGCDEAQGYFMSRPLGAAELTTWLAESHFGASRRVSLGSSVPT